MLSLYLIMELTILSLIQNVLYPRTPAILSVHVLRQFLGILLPRVELELHDVAFVSLDLLVVTDINLLSTLADQSHVVRNHDHSSLEAVDASRQGVDRLHIKRVGRFVQHHQVRLLVCNDCKNNAGFLSSRQLIHNLTLLRSRASKTSEQRSNFFDGFLWHQFLLEKVQWSHGQIKFIFEVLCES